MQNIPIEDPDEHDEPPENYPGRHKRDVVDPDEPFATQSAASDGQEPGGKEYGEGNYKAAKEYDDAARDFAHSGKVDKAAKEAQPRSSQEARELSEAEAKGRSHSKGEDSPSPKQPRQKRKQAV